MNAFPVTVSLDIPADLQGTLHASAAMNGSNVEETIVVLLRDSVSSPASKLVPMPTQRLEPSVYPDEPITDDLDYQSIPFSPVGVVSGLTLTY